MRHSAGKVAKCHVNFVKRADASAGRGNAGMRPGGRQLSEAVRHVYREMRDSVLLKIITGADDVLRAKMRPVPADKPQKANERRSETDISELLVSEHAL